ncbi:fasciclin domain-containing protein [Pedobacter sp. GR22-6]|uniref:fasciclin domain-containing protein n=1 Tax=Pedobacter sp. GR22-6 TaxID=3127957 RepID=UPI00307F6CC6
MNKKIYNLIAIFSLLLLAACKDGWEEHIEVTNTANQQNLFERINSDPSLSKFAAYLQSTKYDEVLASSKTYTVWVPDNAAIDAFNSAHPDYLANPVTLRYFVAYHIVNTSYTLRMSGTDTLRLRTLSSKYINSIGASFEETTVSKANNFAANGVYHIISGTADPKDNLWNSLRSYESTLQYQALASLDTAVVINGDTVINRNAQWRSVASAMSSESSQYTYFVLNDAAFSQETNKIAAYYATDYLPGGRRPDSTTQFLTRLNMLRDVLVPGLYTPDRLPDTLLSVAGTKVPVKKSAITGQRRTSNGIIYFVSELPYRLKDRVPGFRILGQSPSGFKQNDKSGNIYYRTKVDSLGRVIKDIEVYGHGVSEFYIDYRKTNTHVVKYKVYVQAVCGLLGDPQVNAYTQRYQIRNPLNGLYTAPVLTNTGAAANLFTQTLVPKNSDEVYLGEYTRPKYGTLDLRLISAASTSTSTIINTLILSYLRFEPVLP